MNPKIQELLTAQFHDILLSDLYHNTFMTTSHISFATVLEMINFIDATKKVELTIEEIFTLVNTSLAQESFGIDFGTRWMNCNPEFIRSGKREFSTDPVHPNHIPDGDLAFVSNDLRIFPDGIGALFAVADRQSGTVYQFVHNVFTVILDGDQNRKVVYHASTNPMISLFIQYYFWRSLTIACHPEFSKGGHNNYLKLKENLITQNLL